MALAHCIYVKVPNTDLENHLRYGPLLLPCFQCAAFSKRTKIWRTLRFIKSCFGPCCTCQPLLSLPRNTVRGFVRPSSFQHSQQLVWTARATRALAILPAWALAQLAEEHSSCPQATSRSQQKSFLLILAAENKQDSLMCLVTTAFLPSGTWHGQCPDSERKSSPHHLNTVHSRDLKGIECSHLHVPNCKKPCRRYSTSWPDPTHHLRSP